MKPFRDDRPVYPPEYDDVRDDLCIHGIPRDDCEGACTACRKECAECEGEGECTPTEPPAAKDTGDMPAAWLVVNAPDYVISYVRELSALAEPVLCQGCTNPGVFCQGCGGQML